jgi:hypothetical protein
LTSITSRLPLPSIAAPPGVLADHCARKPPLASNF